MAVRRWKWKYALQPIVRHRLSVVSKAEICSFSAPLLAHRSLAKAGAPLRDSVFLLLCIGIYHRAVAVEDGSDIIWFWIGHHSEYDRIIAGRRG